MSIWRDAFDLHLIMACMKKTDPNKYAEVYCALRNGTRDDWLWRSKARGWRKWFLKEYRSKPLYRLHKAWVT